MIAPNYFRPPNNLSNLSDRWSVAAILNDLQAPPEQGGFGLTDTEGGLVTSVFIITYMSLSPLFGYFGDRVPRIPLIVGGICAWSLAGLCASFSVRYWQFLIFRALVGVGEASYAVLAPTIIADLYAGTDRTRVLGWYTASIPLGSALGYIYAGEVTRLFDWRWAFRITPFIGFSLAAILFFAVTEPPRGASDGVVSHPTPHPTPHPASPHDKVEERESGFSGFFRDAVDIWHVRSFFWSTWGAVGMTFTAGALAQWATALLQRVNCDSADSQCEATITRTFGLITIAAGFIGCILGPFLAKMYVKKDGAADAVVSAIALVVCTPFVYSAIYFSPKRYTLTWLLIFTGETLVSFTWPLLTAIQLSVVPPSQRNTANALSLTVSHILGDSVSPIAIGVVADRFYANGKGLSRAVSLQHALYFSVLSSFVAGFFFILCANHLESDRATALENIDSGYREVVEQDVERIQLDSVDDIAIIRSPRP